jgi:hypothetical protein
MGFRIYAGHIIILAAVVLVSCQKATERAEGGTPAAADGQSGQRSETEIPANTAVWVQLEKALDSSKLKVGDRFTGTLAESIVFNGRDVVPKGAAVKGHVSNRQSAQGQGSSGLLSLELDTLGLRGTDYQIKANPLTLESAPLQASTDKSNPATPAVENAFAPKKGVLQFVLSEAVRVKS